MRAALTLPSGATGASVLAVSARRASMLLLVAIAACHIEPSAAFRFSIIAAALMVAALFTRDSSPGSDQPDKNLVLVALLLLIAVPAIRADLGDLADGKVRVWNVYHYYLGAKYFDELGHDGLYVATLAADREGRGVWKRSVKQVRNLTDYTIEPVSKALRRYDPASHFTDTRWQAFRRDVDALRKHRRASDWKGIFRDRGYNGTPVWTAIGGALTRWVPADSPYLVWLCSLDLLLLAAAFALLARAFGGEATLWVMLLFAASPVSIDRLVGGFLQLDWFCAIVAGTALLRLRHTALAGVVFSYALMTRAFPVLMLAAFFLPLLPLLPVLLRQRRLPAQALRFAGGIILGAALLFAASILPAGGHDRWGQFIDAISTHRQDHALGERRIGLAHVFTVDLSVPAKALDKQARAAAASENRAAFLASAVLLLILTAAAAWRLPPPDALLTGMIAVFALLVLSRYYFAILCLLPLIRGIRRGTWRTLVIGQIGLFLVFHGMVMTGYGWHQQYAALNGLLTLYFCGALLQTLRAARVTTTGGAAVGEAAHG